MYIILADSRGSGPVFDNKEGTITVHDGLMRTLPVGEEVLYVNAAFSHNDPLAVLGGGIIVRSDKGTTTFKPEREKLK
jgi:hypothetical protein